MGVYVVNIWQEYLVSECQKNRQRYKIIIIHPLIFSAKSYMMRGNNDAYYSEIRHLGEY